MRSWISVIGSLYDQSTKTSAKNDCNFKLHITDMSRTISLNTQHFHMCIEQLLLSLWDIWHRQNLIIHTWCQSECDLCVCCVQAEPGRPWWNRAKRRWRDRGQGHQRLWGSAHWSLDTNRLLCHLDAWCPSESCCWMTQRRYSTYL